MLSVVYAERVCKANRAAQDMLRLIWCLTDVAKVWVDDFSIVETLVLR